ncbi:hypothetical protein [Glaciibacter sp. 2TAF33]|uniref:hypothetical protein n=1 Tax=Glaciibacter sp. 2TAF33 TaxID=3233015 RepID=UPI003F8E7ED6
MAELQAQVIAEHGPGARIIAADKVTVGGIRGFFARQHFEVTVEVRSTDASAGDTRRGRRAHARLDTQARLGIAALLDDAEEAEARVNGQAFPGPGSVSAGSGSGSSVPGSAGFSTGLSTDSGDFAALMDDLTFNTTPALPMAPSHAVAGPRELAAPRPLSGAGDLVIIIGLHDDALTVAESMAGGGTRLSGAPGDVALAGALAPGYDPAWDRRRAIGARARGVERSQALFIAFGLGSGAARGSGRRALSGAGSTRAESGGRAIDDGGRRDLAACAEAVRAIGADQVWVAVDAGRKPDDTARWIHALADELLIDAVAVVGSEATSSPETVYALALPVGWIDGDLPPAGRRAAGVTNSQARLG